MSDETKTRAPRELLRVLGFGFGLAVVVGGAVGQGILRQPGTVAGVLLDAGLILAFWAIGALLVAIDAFPLVELGASVPRSGGPYALVARAFGPFAGTMVGWTDWVNNVVAIGFMSVVFAEYVQRLGVAASLPTGLLAVATIGVFGILNGLGTRMSGASQGLGSALKGLGLLALVAVLFLAGEPAKAAAPAGFSAPLTLAAVAVALRAIYNTYSGWGSSIYFCEEMHEPARNIARATFGGILLIGLLYVLVNAAMLHVLSPAEMAASKLPAADAAARVFGEASGAIVTLLALVSVGAITNLFVMCTSRIAHAMARDGVLPRAIGLVSANGTPAVALAVTVAGGALLATSGAYAQLVAISAPMGVVIMISIDVAAIRMRYKEPDLDRPFRMPFFPLPAVIGLIINAALLAALIYEAPANSLLGLGFVAAVGLAYAVRAALAKRGLQQGA